jgi:hypothetical protein
MPDGGKIDRLVADAIVLQVAGWEPVDLDDVHARRIGAVDARTEIVFGFFQRRRTVAEPLHGVFGAVPRDNAWKIVARERPKNDRQAGKGLSVL